MVGQQMYQTEMSDDAIETVNINERGVAQGTKAVIDCGLSLAVLIPCFNEEAAVGKVVHAFRAVLPDAAIYVYDNNSTDRTVEVARAAGALVRRETRAGKG